MMSDRRAATRLDLGSDWLERAHVAAAMVYLFGLGFSSNVSAIGFGVLAVIALVRAPATSNQYGPLMRDWVGWAFITWAAVCGLAILWSPNVEQGLDEWRAFRVVFTGAMLWPVLRWTPLLVASFLAGVAGQNIVQLLQAVGVAPTPPGDGMRLRGMTHPVNTAMFCGVAMCWHLSAILTARGMWRWVSVIAGAAAAVGLVATGSRGPWIAAAVGVPACMIGVAWRRPAARRIAIGIAIGAIVLAAASWPLVRGLVENRVAATEQDVALVQQGEVEKNLGLSYRLACWQAALEIARQRPLIGVGAGGFREGAMETSQAAALTDVPHAHSMYLHILACMGTVGAAAMLATVGGAVVRTWRDRWDHPYAAGSFYAMLVWLIAAMFDSLHASGQMLGVFAAIIAITLPARPKPAIASHEHATRSTES